MIHTLENSMYQLSDFFMAPVLILLALLFIYSLIALGAFACNALQRRSNNAHFKQALLKNTDHKKITPQSLSGYPLAALFVAHTHISKDELDVAAFEQLEGVRTVSRIAPMLGLIATMIPMGPALKSLADGDIQGISENLIVAFSAVIFGLVIASITFWIASVRKRWLAKELVSIAPFIQTNHTHQASAPAAVNHTPPAKPESARRAEHETA